MKSTRNIVILLCLLPWCLFLLPSKTLGQETRYECIDDLLDFETNQWQPTQQLGTMEYAESSIDLPGVLAGNFDGYGIFYFNSNFSEGTLGQGVTKNYSDIPPLEPLFLYIKYYTHVESTIGRRVVVYPDLEDLHTDLPLVSEFEWHEKFVQLDPIYWNADHIGAWILNFGRGEYFLIEQIILAQGYAHMGIPEMKTLCPPKPAPTTTTTTVTPPPSTTPIHGHTCSEPGYFADPFDCAVYHHCQWNAVGDLWDTIYTCSDDRVWCQDTRTCEDEQVCPCEISE